MKDTKDESGKDSLFTNEIPGDIRSVIGDSYPVAHDLEQSSSPSYNHELFAEAESIINKLQACATRCKRVISEEITSHRAFFDEILDSIRSTKYDESSKSQSDRELFNKIYPDLPFLKRTQDKILSLSKLSSLDQEILDLFITLQKMLSALKN
jgi:hypothetical protein